MTSRRDFLKAGALGSLSLAGASEQALLSAILMNLFRSSSAEAASLVSARNYVTIKFGGGPLRYQSDHWLRTNETEPAVTHVPHAATSFAYDASTRKVTGTEYRTFKYKDYLVPHFFQTFSVADRARLLDQFLVIRGYGTGIDGHGINTHLQYHPLSSAPSLTGLAADHTAKSFAAIRYPETDVRYLSKTGKSLNILGTQTPLNALLGPLIETSNTRNLSRQYASAFSSVRSALNTARGESKAVDVAQANLKKSFELFNGAVGDFKAEWPILVDKYRTALEAGARNQYIPGINATLAGDQQISFMSDGGSLFEIDPGSEGTYPVGKDLCRVGTHMTFDGLAKGLALADYCIKNDICSVLDIGGGSPNNCNKNPDAAAGSMFDIGNDCHGAGGNLASMIFLLNQRGIFSGLLKFRESMEAAGKWNNTVVQLISEFDRAIGPSGGGSGHGVDQMISSVFSGVIQNGPYVVGNISTMDRSGNNGGTQGVAVPIAGYNIAGVPGPMMMTSTVSELLGVSNNPWKNFSNPLIRLNADGTLALPFGRGKLMAP